MTITYNQKLEFFHHELNVVRTLSRIVSRLPWIFGFVFLFFAGLLYTGTAYLPTLLMRKSIGRLARRAKSGAFAFGEREAMWNHSEIETIRKRLELAIGEGQHFFVIKPIVTEMERALAHFKTFEEVLYPMAYPEKKKVLTSTEAKELGKLFSEWDEDWRDEKMDVYND